MKKDVNTNKVVNLLLSTENEISNKFHNTIIDLLRLGYDSERGQGKISNLTESIQYSLEEMMRTLNR